MWSSSFFKTSSRIKSGNMQFSTPTLLIRSSNHCWIISHMLNAPGRRTNSPGILYFVRSSPLIITSEYHREKSSFFGNTPASWGLSAALLDSPPVATQFTPWDFNFYVHSTCSHRIHTMSSRCVCVADSVYQLVWCELSQWRSQKYNKSRTIHSLEDSHPKTQTSVCVCSLASY